MFVFLEKQALDQEPMKDNIIVLFETFFYVGKIPWASGTWGSAAGLLLFWALASQPLLCAGVFLILTLAGLVLGSSAERIFGRKDPHPVVIDEVAGIFPAFFMMPPSFAVIAAGFVIYRALDVLKPLFIRRLERLPGGWGIMADDLACGLCVQAILRILFVLNILR